MACPGVLLAWSGGRVRAATIRIPPDGLMLGRDLLDEHVPGHGDDRSSRQHARVVIENGRAAVLDESSRNGTYVNGQLVDRKVASRFPAVVRTGRSVWTIVDNIEPYEGRELLRLESLVVRSTLPATFAAVDDAARAGRHLVLVGAFCVGRELARRYSRPTGGIARVVSGSVPLATALGRKRARTIAIELDWALDDGDIETLRGWLAADRRIVVLTKTRTWVDRFPPDVRAELATVLAIPELRLDELPATVVDTIERAVPGIEIHATVLEAALCYAISGLDEDLLLGRIETSLARRDGLTKVRGEDLDLDDQGDPFERCVIIANGVRRMGVRPVRQAPKPTGQVDTAMWAARRLCPDGSCTGLIGPDNACRTCGKTVPLDDPYR